MAHRGRRAIALLFHDHGTGRGVRGQRYAPAALYPRERPGTHCTGGWVGSRDGLKRYKKSLPPPAFDPRTVQSLTRVSKEAKYVTGFSYSIRG